MVIRVQINTAEKRLTSRASRQSALTGYVIAEVHGPTGCDLGADLDADISTLDRFSNGPLLRS
jgi:hypothetical protein